MSDSADLKAVVQKQNETIRLQQEQIDELISHVQNLKTALMDLRRQFETFSGQAAVKLPGAWEMQTGDSYDLTGFTSSPHSMSSPLLRSRTSSLETGTLSDLPNRAKRIEEIVQTERAYIMDLELIIQIFLIPLQQNGVISNQEIMGLFANLPSILEVNRKMLLLFEETVRSHNGDYMLVNLGEIFLEMAEQFKVYEEYCGNQQNALSLYEGLKENQEFVAFLEACDSNPKCRGLPLFSFLIKPVQRICKYPLLLKDLIRDTDESMEDWRTLTAAKHKIDGIAEKVNENQKAAEGAQARELKRLVDIANNIDTEDEELNLAAPHRRFLFEGDADHVVKKDKKPRHLWLFNDMLIVCAAKSKKDRFVLKKRFDIKNVNVIDVADMDGLKNAFEIKSKGANEATTFSVESLEIKNKWVAKLKAVIKDFQLQAVQRAKKAQGPLGKLSHGRQASSSFGTNSMGNSMSNSLSSSMGKDEGSDSGDQVSARSSSPGWVSAERGPSQSKLNVLGSPPLQANATTLPPPLPGALPPMSESPKAMVKGSPAKAKFARPTSQSLPDASSAPSMVNPNASPGPVKVTVSPKRPPPQFPAPHPPVRVFIAKK